MWLQEPPRQSGDFASCKADAAGGRIDQTDDAARYRGFAGTAFADDAERAALAQGQRHVLGGRDVAGSAEQRALAIDFAKFVGLQHDGFLGIGARRARHEARHGGEQVAGVFHGRAAQDGIQRGGFDEPSLPHDGDAIGNLGDHAHVVGDEQHGGAVIALQVADQREDLLLRGDVEGRRRLIRDQEFWLQHQRHRDHDALALAARQPVRIGGKDPFDLGQPHLFHHLEDALAPGAGVEIGMGPQHLVDLAADRHHRIECRHRFLENHRHGGRAQLPQAAVACGEQLFTDQFDAAAGGDQRTFLQQAHHGQRGHRFAGSAFADQAQRLALDDLQ